MYRLSIDSMIERIRKTIIATGIGVFAASPAFAISNRLYTTDIDQALTSTGQIKTSQSILIRDPRILNVLFDEHSLGEKLNDLAYFMRVTMYPKNEDDLNLGYLKRSDYDKAITPGSTRNSRFFDAITFVTQNALMKANCQALEHNEVVLAARQGKPYDKLGGPFAPINDPGNGVHSNDALSLAIGINAQSAITPYRHLLELWKNTFNENSESYNGFAKVLSKRERVDGRQIHGTQCPHEDPNGNYKQFQVADAICDKARSIDRADPYCYRKGILGKGPFRLLAISNRMDLSGQNNLSGTAQDPYAGFSPRTLGELHLIYGLVDPEYERRTGQPYPMTLQVTYRLPALDEHFARAYQGSFEDKSDFIEESKYMRNLARAGWHSKWGTEWRTQMQRWAQLWQQLSRLDFNNSAERQRATQHLHAILERAATADQFINFNVNSTINGRFDTSKKRIVSIGGSGLTNELKVYYNNANMDVLNSANNLTEPHRCYVNTDYLRHRINGYSASFPHIGINSLVLLGNIGHDDQLSINAQGKSSRDYRSGFTIGGPNEGTKPEHRHIATSHNGKANDVLSACRDADLGVYPWYTDKNKKPGNFYLGNSLRGFFMRTDDDFYWEFKNINELPRVPENLRHSFSMNTCSGCHGKETGANGFHIHNRTHNGTAKLSNYLGKNNFETGPILGTVAYGYNTLERRRDWLFAAGEKASYLRPGDGIVRQDYRVLEAPTPFVLIDTGEGIWTPVQVDE